MKNNAIQIQGVTLEQFSEFLTGEIKETSKLLIRELASKKSGEELLTRDEACEFLKINSSTLHGWTKSGRLKSYGIGSRRYYKKDELIESLIPLTK